MKKLSYQKVLRHKRYHTEHTQIGCPDAVHHPSFALRQKTMVFFLVLFYISFVDLNSFFFPI